ncbi:MAG: hypothetical protein ACPGRD_09070, partial [Planktomarina sp.]
SGLALISIGIVMSSGFTPWVKIPVVFIQSLPYILTVVVLAGFVGKATPPKAGGVPYVKEK